MNLLDGTAARKGGAPVVSLGGADLALPTDTPLAEGRQVTVGIRPEHLRLAEAGLAGTVSVVEPTGSETHVVIRSDGREIVSVFRDRHPFKPGQPLHLAAEPQHLHLFDRASGVRIG